MMNTTTFGITATLLLAALGTAHGETYTETFEDYPPTIMQRNARDAFGSWRTVLMDGQSEIGPAAAGAVPDNATQVLHFNTVGTDRASALDDTLSFTEGKITLAFDFLVESATGTNTFFLANSTDGANAGAATTLFKLSLIDQDNERFRIGTEAQATSFSGTAASTTLAYGQWYRFDATVDLDEGVFNWRVLDNEGEATRIRFGELAINSDSEKALESLWFGKIGAANDLTGAVDNISVTPEGEQPAEPD